MEDVIAHDPDPASGQSGSTSIGWTTGGLGPRDGFRRYREVIGDAFVPLAATLHDEDAFHASVDHAGSPELGISTVRAGAHEIRRTPRLIGRADGAHLMVTVQVAGRSAMTQDGRETDLGPGSMVFCDSTRPFGFRFDGDFEQVVAQLPRTLLEARSGLTDRLTGRATAVRLDPTGPVPTITAFLSSMADLAARDPAGAAALVDPATAMIAAALAMVAGTGPTGPDARELARARVREYLRARHVDPGLDADAVARGCHLSRRSLFRLFADTPDSLAGELRRIRVEHAARLVRARPRMPVAAVAEATGFAGETQLYRAFHTVLGTSLSRFRAGLPAAPRNRHAIVGARH